MSQCVGPAAIDASRVGSPFGLAGRGLAYDGLGYDGLAAPFGLAGRGWAGCSPAMEITATTGGGLPVASGSAIPTVGVSVASENVYEGILAAAGELPFVGTVGVDGVLPTAGGSAVNYGCGNGVTAMAADAGIAGPLGYGAGIAGPFGLDSVGYGAGIAGPLSSAGTGWAGRGCGCGLA